MQLNCISHTHTRTQPHQIVHFYHIKETVCDGKIQNCLFILIFGMKSGTHEKKNPQIEEQ